MSSSLGDTLRLLVNPNNILFDTLTKSFKECASIGMYSYILVLCSSNKFLFSKNYLIPNNKINKDLLKWCNDNNIKLEHKYTGAFLPTNLTFSWNDLKRKDTLCFELYTLATNANKDKQIIEYLTTKFKDEANKKNNGCRVELDTHLFEYNDFNSTDGLKYQWLKNWCEKEEIKVKGNPNCTFLEFSW